MRVGLLIDAPTPSGTVTSDIRWFADDSELQDFIHEVETALASDRQLCGWDGYDFELLGETRWELELLRQALAARRAPPVLVSYAMIYERPLSFRPPNRDRPPRRSSFGHEGRFELSVGRDTRPSSHPHIEGTSIPAYLHFPDGREERASGPDGGISLLSPSGDADGPAEQSCPSAIREKNLVHDSRWFSLPREEIVYSTHLNFGSMLR